jgi:putative DNA primase/helicase
VWIRIPSLFKPIINGTDEGIWRRINLIPFKVTVPDHKVDKYLQDKLRTELPGILKWAVDGCLEWEKSGLEVPSEVTSATESYRTEMDAVAAFITECCVIEKTAKTKASFLYIQFQSWCTDTGAELITSTAFGKRMKERFVREKEERGLFYYGIGLKDEAPPSLKAVA